MFDGGCPGDDKWRLVMTEDDWWWMIDGWWLAIDEWRRSRLIVMVVDAGDLWSNMTDWWWLTMIADMTIDYSRWMQTIDNYWLWRWRWLMVDVVRWWFIRGCWLWWLLMVTMVDDGGWWLVMMIGDGDSCRWLMTIDDDFADDWWGCLICAWVWCILAVGWWLLWWLTTVDDGWWWWQLLLIDIFDDGLLIVA